MPKFFFNIHCDTYQATDLVGEVCSDAVAARFEAHRTARELVREALSNGEFPQRGWVEVEDEQHRPVLILPLKAVAF